MLTVDLLHEFELGVWKDFLAHIIRILEFLGPDNVQTFNERYEKGYSFLTPSDCPCESFRQVPTFGETTIRRFADNVSEMKRLAGHDFEDLLQVTL